MDAFARSRPRGRLKLLLAGLAALLLAIGAGYLLARAEDRREQRAVAAAEVDRIVVALRENRNRLEVHRLAGTVTTRREVRGGFADLLEGELTVRQPWSVSYFADMSQLGLDDYIWDSRTRTLSVRMPAVRPDPPNIDESRQVAAQDGLIITRDMQAELRTGIARGARQQAAAEAGRAENLTAATAAARAAIARNLQGPLAAAGLGDVRVVVQAPGERTGDGERWDVSRSIAEVLAERDR